MRQHPLRTANYLQHMAQAIDNIQSYPVGMDAASFKEDRKTQDAVIRNLEIIGEACNNVVRTPVICPGPSRDALGLCV